MRRIIGRGGIAWALAAVLVLAGFEAAAESHNVNIEKVAASAAAAQISSTCAVPEDPAEARPSDTLLTFVGSDSVGSKLVPCLAVLYLKNLGSRITRAVRLNDTDLRIVGTLDNGRAVAIEIIATRSSEAFQALLDKKADFGMSSREIRPAEARALASLGDMTSKAAETPVALGGVVVIVNRANPVKGMTLDTVRDVFSGKISDWSQLGAPPGPIRTVARTVGSASRELFEDEVMRNLPLAFGTSELTENKDITEALAANPLAIGFTSMEEIGPTKPLAIGYSTEYLLLPSRETILTEDYVLARRLYLYRAPGRDSANIQRFLRLAESYEGKLHVALSGLVPMGIDLVAPDIQQPRPKNVRDLVTNGIRVGVPLHFDADRMTLSNETEKGLDHIAVFLRNLRVSITSLRLIGYAGVDPASEDLRQLSLAMVNEVGNELTKRLVPVGIKVGLGGIMPLDSEDTPRGRARNRRVEIWLTP